MAELIHIGITLAYLLAFYLFAVLFTNGIEWLGVKFNLSTGAMGSVFAAVGTALPETLVAIFAIFGGAVAASGEMIGHEIGIGAILGAPFLLSSLAFFVIGITYVICKRRGIRKDAFSLNASVISTDIGYFLIAFSLAAVAGLLPTWLSGITIWGHCLSDIVHIVLGISLVVVYINYVKKVVKTGGTYSEHPGALLFSKWARGLMPSHSTASTAAEEGNGDAAEEPSKSLVVTQLLASLAVLFLLAWGFVQEIEWLSNAFNAPALIIALLVIPIATELPEKLNSIIWVRSGQDTLAMGNVSGAMVFQSSIPVTIGLLFTEWSFELQSYAFAACALTLISGLLVWTDLKMTGEVHYKTLLVGGLFYIAFILLIVFGAFPG